MRQQLFQHAQVRERLRPALHYAGSRPDHRKRVAEQDELGNPEPAHQRCYAVDRVPLVADAVMPMQSGLRVAR